MKPSPLATGITFALALASLPAFASAAGAPASSVKDLDAVTVHAQLDQARNTLSPDIGSSQYQITAEDIQKQPLGASAPLSQVLLQAPGMVQDSYGGVHVRGDHANLQYRINGVLLPESISGFGQTLDARTIKSIRLMDGALPAQFGERTAAVVDITTRNGAGLGNGGSAGLTTGSFGKINPNASWWGSQGRWSWFLTGNYDQNEVGLENPTNSRKPLHDDTHQGKAFADLTYLVNDNTRLSVFAGFANNRFQIPVNPGQTPQFGYLDTTTFDSSQLDETQRETTRFGMLVLQGTLGRHRVPAIGRTALQRRGVQPGRGGRPGVQWRRLAGPAQQPRQHPAGRLLNAVGQRPHAALWPVRQLRERAGQQQQLGVPG